jgi:hypothetical protein
MKKLLIITLLILAGCGESLNHNWGDLIIAQKYVPGIEDLPVYSGFKQIGKNNVIYDSESGRIIDISYSGNDITVNDVQNYYSETLPQLGWSKNKSSEYIRDGECLKVSIKEDNGVVFLKFTIKPLA